MYPPSVGSRRRQGRTNHKTRLPERLPSSRASSHLDLGQPAAVEAGFAGAQKLFDPAIVRTQALYLARQGIAQADQGHLDRACATATRALDLTESIGSRRTAGPLMDLARRLSDITIREQTSSPTGHTWSSTASRSGRPTLSVRHSGAPLR